MQEAVHPHESQQLALGVGKVRLRLESLGLNAEHVVQDGRVVDVVHRRQVGLASQDHREDLPALLAVSAYAAKVGPAVHLGIGVLRRANVGLWLTLDDEFLIAQDERYA